MLNPTAHAKQFARYRLLKVMRGSLYQIQSHFPETAGTVATMLGLMDQLHRQIKFHNEASIKPWMKAKRKEK